MPPAVAAAGVTAGAGIVGGAMAIRGQREAGYRQWQAQQEAIKAQREQEAEENRRYQERWDDYQRRYQEWIQRRDAATGPRANSRYTSWRPSNTPTASPTTAPPTNETASTPAAVPQFGVDPSTGLPRTLGDIATWNDWSQYGLR